MLGDLGKLIAAKGFKKLPKVQKITRFGHTVFDSVYCSFLLIRLLYESKILFRSLGLNPR